MKLQMTEYKELAPPCVRRVEKGEKITYPFLSYDDLVNLTQFLGLSNGVIYFWLEN